jgi:hypothetical protein
MQPNFGDPYDQDHGESVHEEAIKKPVAAESTYGYKRIRL